MNAFDDLSPPDLEGSSEESSDSNRTNEEMKALFRGNFGRVRTQQVKFFFLCHLFNKRQRSFALVLGVVLCLILRSLRRSLIVSQFNLHIQPACTYYQHNKFVCPLPWHQMR